MLVQYTVTNQLTVWRDYERIILRLHLLYLLLFWNYKILSLNSHLDLKKWYLKGEGQWS